MKSIKLLSFCAIALLFVACDKSGEQATAMPPLPVTAMKLVQADQPLKLSYNGQTVSELDVVLKAKVSGTIEEQFFTPGAQVKEGDKLYQIDLERYKALYESARGGYQAAAATQKSASSDFARTKILKEKNAVSQKDYDNALAATNAASANANSALAMAKNAKLDLEFASLSAPFDGVVGDSKKDVGSFVAAGEELVRLSKLNPIYVKFGMSDVKRLEMENNLANGAWQRLNPSVKIVLNDKEYKGKLVFIDSVVNSNTANVEAKAVFENNNLEIKPGIYTKIEVDGFVQKNAFRIPQLAVSQDPKGSYVYTAKDGKVEKKYIKIASNADYDYIVNEGLENNDILILDNFKKISAGAAVQIINDPNNPQAKPAGIPNDNNASK